MRLKLCRPKPKTQSTAACGKYWKAKRRMQSMRGFLKPTGKMLLRFCAQPRRICRIISRAGAGVNNDWAICLCGGMFGAYRRGLWRAADAGTDCFDGDG